MRKDELKSRARELERAGQSVAAREVYVGLAPQEEPEGAALVWRRVAQIDLSAGNESSARESLSRAAELFVEAGQLNNALAVCLQLVDLAPQDGTTHLKLAELATTQGYRDLARTWAIRSAASVKDPSRLEHAARVAGIFGARFPIDTDFWRHWAEGALSARGPEGAIQALQTLQEQASGSGASPHALNAIRAQLGRLGPSGANGEPGLQGVSPGGAAPTAPETGDTFISPGPLLTEGWSDGDPADVDLHRASRSIREPEPTWEPSSSRVIPLEGLQPTHAEAWEPATTEPEEQESLEDLPLLGATETGTPDLEPLMPWSVDTAPAAEEGHPSEEGVPPLPWLLDAPTSAASPPEEEQSPLPWLVTGTVPAPGSPTDPSEPPLPWLANDTLAPTSGSPPHAGTPSPSWLDADTLYADHASLPAPTGPSYDSWPDEDLPLIDASPATGVSEPSDLWLEDAPEPQEPAGDSAQPLPLLAPLAVAGSQPPASSASTASTASTAETPSASAPDPAGRDAGSIDPEEDPLAFLDELPSADAASPDLHPAPATGLSPLHRELETIVTRKVHPSDAATHYDLGLAFKEMGLTEEAIAQLAAAIAAGFRTLAGLEVMGEVLHSRGDYTAAARILRYASDERDSTDSDLIGVLYWLGRSEQALGNSSDARQLFRRVVAVDPAFRDTTDRLSSAGSAPL